MSDLVGNSEDRFSRDTAQFTSIYRQTGMGYYCMDPDQTSSDQGLYCLHICHLEILWYICNENLGLHCLLRHVRLKSQDQNSRKLGSKQYDFYIFSGQRVHSI